MNTDQLQLLLADDDEDDCFFFKEALDELSLSVHLTTVHDGVQLMQLLAKKLPNLPHILFLDLNMPRKSGYECLLEIKGSEELKRLPVVILSTSSEQDVVNQLYRNGANYCMGKPTGHSELKVLIQEALMLMEQEIDPQPTNKISV